MKVQLKRLLLTTLICCFAVCAILSMTVFNKNNKAYAQEAILYIDENGVEQSTTNYVVFNNNGSSPNINDNAEFIYFDQKNAVLYNPTGDFSFSTDKKLIIKDGASVIFTCTDNDGRLHNKSTNPGLTLTIYGQKQQTGEMYFSGQDGSPATYAALQVDGGTLNIYGAKINISQFDIGLKAKNINIANKCSIKTTGGSTAIYADGGDVNIKDGKIEITGSMYPFYSSLQDKKITIDGGELSCTCKSTAITFHEYIQNGGNITISPKAEYIVENLFKIDSFTFNGGSLDAQNASGKVFAQTLNQGGGVDEGLSTISLDTKKCDFAISETSVKDEDLELNSSYDVFGASGNTNITKAVRL